MVAAALRALGNAKPDIARGLLDLAVAVLAAGEIARTLAAGGSRASPLVSWSLFEVLLPMLSTQGGAWAGSKQLLVLPRACWSVGGAEGAAWLVLSSSDSSTVGGVEGAVSLTS